MAKTKSLPTIKEHFQDTWNRLTSGLLPAFMIALIAFLLVLAALAVFGLMAGVLLAGGTGIVESLSSPGVDMFEILSTIPKSTYALAGLLFVAFVAVMAAIGSIGQVGQIMAFAEANRKPKVGALLRRAIQITPAFIAFSLIVAFLTLGSFWLFLFPVLVVSLFLTFGMYEVVLEGAGPLQAIKDSVAMVSDHFGYVVGRILIFIGIYLLIFIVLPGMVEELAFITLILSFFWGWFSLAYMVSLYRSIKQVGYDRDQKTWWLWALAIVGWLIFIVGFSAIKNFVGSGLMEEMRREMATDVGSEIMIDSDSTLDQFGELDNSFDFDQEFDLN